MRVLGLALTLAVLLLQHRLWLSADGCRAVQGLGQQLAAARAENQKLEARNLHLLVHLGYLAPPQIPGEDQPAAARLAGNTRSGTQGTER